MKKTALATALALSLGTTALTAEAGTPGITGVFNDQYIFTMTDPNDIPVGVPTPPQDWVFDFDAGTVSITNTATFYGSVWTAHDVTFMDNGDGTYSGIVGPGAPGDVTNDFANMLFDWSVNLDIPVEIVWDVTLIPPGDTINVKTLSTVILDFSSAFPGFQPAFNSAAAVSLTCGEFFAVTNEEVSVDINIQTDLLDSCVFADGTVVLDSYSQPANGTVTDNGTVLTYLPNAGFGGLDTFTYTAIDNSATSPAATVSVQVGGELQGNFSMMDSTGAVFGGTNDVVFTWDGTSLNTDESDTDFSIMGIKSDRPQPFNGFVWTAHNIRVYGPGTYSFDTGCDVAQLESTGCPAGTVGGATMTMTVGPDQFGAHILFDWNTSVNIDVVNVWDQNKQWDRLGNTGEVNKLWLGTAGLPPAEDANWELVSTDVDGDGINGSPMVDGPFVDFSANFNNKPDKAGIPPEPFVNTQQDTELGSGILASMNIVALFASLMMLVGLRHIGRKK